MRNNILKFRYNISEWVAFLIDLVNSLKTHTKRLLILEICDKKYDVNEERLCKKKF